MFTPLPDKPDHPALELEILDVWERDHTAWKEEPTEIADRLGWLDVPELMARELGDIQEFARKARAMDGVGLMPRRPWPSVRRSLRPPHLGNAMRN